MAIENVRFKGLVKTTAEIQSDQFEGRHGWSTTLARFIYFFGASSFGIQARTDVLETFAAGIKDSTITAGQALVSGTGGRLVGMAYATFAAAIDAWTSATLPVTTFAKTILAAVDAAAARSVLGAQATIGTVTREMALYPQPITNSAPDVVTLGPSGSMKSRGFDGSTQVEELFYESDNQHDLSAGTNGIAHAHWAQATNGTGTVVMKFDVQWIDGGGPILAPVTYSCPAVNVNGTAWAEEQKSEVSIPGAGHTYNSRLKIRLYRDPTQDTYTGDAVLTGVGIHYTANITQAG